MTNSTDALADIFQEARSLLARPDNDFSWSSWPDEAAALAEVDVLLAELARGAVSDPGRLDVLFLPTGPICEVSVSSGWGEEYVALGKRFDQAMRHWRGDPEPSFFRRFFAKRT